MEEHRSIQDIIPPARSKPIRQPLQTSGGHIPPPTPPQPMNLRPEKSNLATFVFIAAGVFVVAGIGIGLLSTVFHRAYVTVTPYVFTAKVEESVQTTPQGAVLPYQKVSVTDTATKNVAATGVQHVENHSSGTVTIYNAYSTTPQRLITNTRFQTKDGLVYKIHAPVVVPGYTMKAGVKAPGTIDAVVYADEAGDKYNVAPSDFTLPGLKDTKQHQLIYAKSVAPFAGGFIGEQAVVDQTLRAQTVDALKTDLDRTLRSKIVSATVAGNIIFNESVSIAYTENSDVAAGKSEATISVSGTATAPAFAENAMAHEFAGTSGVSYDGPLSIQNPSDLSVHVDPASAIGSDTPLSVSVAGTATLVSVFDQTALKKDLAGKNKKDIKTVLPSYPAISTLDVKIYPFWLSGLPSDPSKVSLTVVNTAPQATP